MTVQRDALVLVLAAWRADVDGVGFPDLFGVEQACAVVASARRVRCRRGGQGRGRSRRAGA